MPLSVPRFSQSQGNFPSAGKVAWQARGSVGIGGKMISKQDDSRRNAVERQIDENLRRVYEQDVTEQIPERFLELLKQLREKE
ncbi:NepR family anti-sigma factor [Paracoccus marinaquae]|nr:NepR family anti-sigma factor [Paracoccus marinaquae]